MIIKKPKAKTLAGDMPRKVKIRKIKSVNAKKQHVKQKCRFKIETLLDETDPGALSFRMRTCPTAKQLKGAERDLITALLSFAVNSG